MKKLIALAATLALLAPVVAEASVCRNIYRGRTPVCVKRTTPPMNGSALAKETAKRTNAGPLVNR